MLPGRGPRAGLLAAACACTLLAAACGVVRRAPAPSASTAGPNSAASQSAARSGASSASASASASGGSASQSGAQYSAYYRVNGTALLAGGSALAMTANDFMFTPDTLTVKSGTPVRLRVRNVSQDAHNFTSPALGVSVALPAGKTTSVAFTPTRPGVYWFWCSLPGHVQAGMVGKLTVT